MAINTKYKYWVKDKTGCYYYLYFSPDGELYHNKCFAIIYIDDYDDIWKIESAPLNKFKNIIYCDYPYNNVKCTKEMYDDDNVIYVMRIIEKMISDYFISKAQYWQKQYELFTGVPY